MSEESEKRWHLDKRVPVALIFAILMQTAAGTWWAATISGDVARNRDDISRLEKNGEVTSELKDRVIRLEYVLDRLDRTLQKVEQKLEK